MTADDTEPLPPLGARIRALLVHKGMTQAALARALDLPDSRTLWRYVKTGSAPRDMKRFLAIARALGTTAEWLENGGDDGPIPDPAPTSRPEPGGEDSARAAAVDACAAQLGHERRPVLEKLVLDVAASDGNVERIARALVQMYRGWLAEHELTMPLATARVDQGRQAAGEQLTDEPRKRGDAKGHMPLLSSKKKT